MSETAALGCVAWCRTPCGHLPPPQYRRRRGLLDELEARQAIVVGCAYVRRWLPEQVDKMPPWGRSVRSVVVSPDDTLMPA